MALPRPEQDWSEPAGTAAATTDWESLRHDLEALLHQVENRHLRTGAGTGDHGADRDTPDSRHRAALRSVQKAVDRFSEPARSSAPRQRNDLETAINEIRSRTGGHSQSQSTAYADPHMPESFAEDLRAEQAAARAYVPRQPDPAPQRPETRHAEPPRYTTPRFAAPRDPEPQHATETPREDRGEAVSGLKQLTAAVSGMAGRLERLEADMRATRDASGDMTEIAAQVSQLTHVVELIAGAVGEQGQVKRLEHQIADLARLYSDGPKPEITALTRRIDELGATVDRLAEMQVREMGRTADGAAAQQSDAMRIIEDGVRSIYDRIDALERSYAVAPDDLDRLTREMAGVTEALHRSDDTSGLADIVRRLDALSVQIESMGRQGDSSVSALRDDVEALRQIVGEAVEPRFAAIERSIQSLSNKVGSDAGAAGSPSFSQLEDQIRELALRMDQTGQQLDGLTELYKTDAGRGTAPDYETLAAMVAERTSQEFARLRGDESGLDETSLGALEDRLSKLFSSNQGGDGSGLLSNVAENLTRVDERLNRLESTLEELARKGIAPAQAPVPQSPAPQASAPAAAPARTAQAMPDAPEAAVQSQPDTETLPAARKPDAEPAPQPAMSDPSPMPRTRRAPQQDDAMPHAPGNERPLVDDEMSTLSAPVEDWSSLAGDEAPQHRQPASTPAGPPGLDFSKIERPARPKSSFADEPASFTPLEDEAPSYADAAPEDEETPASDRSTFIAAARRAARGNIEAQNSGEASHSLIGRALARFQARKDHDTEQKPDTVAEDVAPAKPAKPNKKKAKKKAADEPSQMPPAMDDIAEGRASIDDFGADVDDRSVVGENTSESFLSRHRRSLILAGALVATVLLAGNLVLQRLMPDAAPADAAPTETSSTGAMIDPTPTGSVDPFIEMNLTKPSPTRQVLPATLSPEPLNEAPEIDRTLTHSVPPAALEPVEVAPAPIKLDLPPAELGPLELRQAAADGDPRAQFEVGAIYTEGSVIDQDFEAAATWYERSAAQGFAPAQYRLGNLYEHGDGVDKDLEQARLWYSRAAESGNRLAMHNLAAIYASGALGEQQFASAAEWFERASEAGMTDSQFNLGMLYARGLGVTQDLKASYKWFSLAAEEGDTDAAKARDDIGKSLDAAALDEAKAEIAAWHMAPINIPANFAPIGTWSDSFDPGQSISETSVTEGVQRALARLGYDPGTIDGVMGPKTTQAITEFERATGMTPTGFVNPRLLAVLGSQPV